jgi:hypothetical protein
MISLSPFPPTPVCNVLPREADRAPNASIKGIHYFRTDAGRYRPH